MLIRPGLGSYFFLSEVILDIGVSSGRSLQLANVGNSHGCGSCYRCAPYCPTGAIVSDGVIDSARCISYLTIEKKSNFTFSETKAVGEWIFGCDLCQECCPFNHKQHLGLGGDFLTEFRSEFGSGSSLALEEVLNISDNEQYLEKFAGTPLMRAGRTGLIRNALANCYNLGQIQLIDRVRELASCDSSEVIRRQSSLVLERWESVRT